MSEDNFLLHFDDNKKRQYFLKKIKLSNFPELQKDYNDFFTNNINYFNNNYKNNYILVGKLHENKDKEGLIHKIKLSKGKSKKFLFNSSKISNSKIISEDSSHGEKKKPQIKFNKDTSLKMGQQYIDDYQLEDLFNKFNVVKKLNKSKTKNFITVKDLIEKKIKINAFKNQSKNENKSKHDFNETNLAFHKINENNNIDYNKTISTSISNPNFKFEHINNSHSSKNILTNNNNYKSGFNSSKNIFLKNNNNNKNKKFMSTFTHFCLEDKIKLKKKKNVKKRHRTINRQNQFLLNDKGGNFHKNISEKKYFSELLANQEQVLLKSSKSQTKLDFISNKLSKKINKEKNDLLILNTDNYRIKYELLTNIEKYNKKIEPEHYYNWYEDLRTISNTNISEKNKNNIFSIRNPLRNEIKIKFGKNKSLINIKKIINNVNKVSHNYKDMIINGKDLLQMEFDFAKSLKNRKKLNNFEAYLPTIDVEDKYFASENKFTKNK